MVKIYQLSYKMLHANVFPLALQAGTHCLGFDRYMYRNVAESRSTPTAKKRKSNRPRKELRLN